MKRKQDYTITPLKINNKDLTAYQEEILLYIDLLELRKQDNSLFIFTDQNSTKYIVRPSNLPQLFR